MNKKKIGLIIILVIIVMLIGMIFIINKQEDNKVKRYEVSIPEKDDSYVNINVLDNIDLKELTETLLVKYDNNEQNLPISELSNKKAFRAIINILKDYDKDFKEAEYKVTYNFPYDDKDSYYITIGYYIDRLIETNKAYIVYIVDNKIENITLAGVIKKNLDNISTVNKEELINLAKSFNGEEKTSSIFKNGKKYFKNNSILNEDDSVNIESLKGNIISLDEKYSYDYNSQKLQYILLFCERTDDIGSCSSIEIDLN